MTTISVNQQPTCYFKYYDCYDKIHLFLFFFFFTEEYSMNFIFSVFLNYIHIHVKLR